MRVITGVVLHFSTGTIVYFSTGVYKHEQILSRQRKALRMYEQARAIQDSIENNRGLPRRYRINNVLVDIEYSFQTKLDELSEEEALKLANKVSINGREGFFCLVSSENLTLQEALSTYRKKDSIEKIMNSLKNEIEIKPLRVRKDESINGALLIGFLALLFISLMRYEHVEIRNISTKFIKISLSSLTVTVEYHRGREINRIYSNFDPINRVVLHRNYAKT